MIILSIGISVVQAACDDVDRDILASVIQGLGGTSNPPVTVGAVVMLRNKRIKKTARKPFEHHVVISDDENSSRTREQIGQVDELEGGHGHDKGKKNDVTPNLDEDEVTEISPQL